MIVSIIWFLICAFILQCLFCNKRQLIGFYNYYLLQLFFIRLTMRIKEDEIKINSVMYFVLPFTGWNSNYKFIGRQKHFKL